MRRTQDVQGNATYYDDGDDGGGNGDGDGDDGDDDEEEEEEEEEDTDDHLVILELMVDILNMTSWRWNTEEDDPRPAGNQWPRGTRGIEPGPVRGGGQGLTGKFQGFQRSWCLPIPC